MRKTVDLDSLHRFMRELGRRAGKPARVYLVGGAAALLEGWRPSTIDIDVKFVPENDELFRAVAEMKNELDVNIELAAPSDFIPPLPGWEDRSRFITREGLIDFLIYDLYSQALAKIERSHRQDLADVEAMFDRQLIEKSKVKQLFDEITPQLYRYPSIDPEAFRAAVDRMIDRD
jgi:hypothetical protein